MILTLTPQGLADAQPLRLDRRGAVLGRTPDADLVLPAAAVSSRHCRIEWRDEAYYLIDTSSNGTVLDGKPVTAPERLADGACFEIGPYRVGVSLKAAVAETQPRPVSPMNLQSWDRGGGAAKSPVPAPTPALAASLTMRQPAAVPSSSLPLPPGADAASRLLHAAGVARTAVAADGAAVLDAAGRLLHQLTAGMMAMLKARAQARSELGAGTAAATDSPLHRSGSAEAALAQLLAHPDAAEQAVAEALAELGNHQQATLYAMQGALRATLDTLAPDAIRQRIQGSGTRDPASLWQAYEQAFAGAGSDASFIALFARELGTAYAKLADAGRV